MLEREKSTGKLEQSLLFKELPIDNCRYERNQANGEWGWKTPENKIFRVTGAFVVFTDQSSNDMVSYEPQESLDSFKKAHMKKISESSKGNR